MTSAAAGDAEPVGAAEPGPATPVRAEELALPGGAMLFDAAAVARPGQYLFDPADDANQARAVSEGGRQAAWFVQGTYGQGVLRHYRRGGLIARISRNRYVWAGAQATRSFAEFRLLAYMHGRGLPVPRPLAAAYWRRGPSYRAAILVGRIAGARPLAQALDEGHHAAAAAAVFSMHEAGVWHADLNAYNILIDEGGRAWLIDFDKGRRRALSMELRHGNLARLRRSLLKVAGGRGLAWWEEFARDYGRLDATKGHI